MISYRITKYNPKLRIENDIYKENEWTSFCDIGKVFDGVEFTKEEYMLTEVKYINVVLSVIRTCNISTLKVKSLEKYSEETDFKNEKITFSKEIESTFNNIKEGDIINVDEIENLIKLILREKIWCKLVFKRNFFIHFGYDFYMYVGCELSLDSIKQAIGGIGLYVEEKESPYL